MGEDVRQRRAVRTRTVPSYAAIVAEDCHLASEFAQLHSVGDTTDALEVVARAVGDILDHCDNMLVVAPTGQNGSILQSLSAIDQVARRSDELGDEIQASWCGLLRQTIIRGERPPTS